MLTFTAFRRAYRVAQPWLTPLLFWVAEGLLRQAVQEAERCFPALAAQKTGPRKKVWALNKLHKSADKACGGDVPFLGEDQERALIALVFGPLIDLAIAAGMEKPEPREN